MSDLRRAAEKALAFGVDWLYRGSTDYSQELWSEALRPLAEALYQREFPEHWIDLLKVDVEMFTRDAATDGG